MRPTLFHFLPFTRAHAEEMLSWRYPSPYDLYNAKEPVTDESIRALLSPELNYFAVTDQRGDMIAFRCFGMDAQVAGGDYTQDALDMGGGLRPDLTGQGLGAPIIASTMNYAVGKFSPSFFRTTVASFNHRARKVCERVGYSYSSRFMRASDGRHFDILLAKAPAHNILQFDRTEQAIRSNATAGKTGV